LGAVTNTSTGPAVGLRCTTLTRACVAGTAGFVSAVTNAVTGVPARPPTAYTVRSCPSPTVNVSVATVTDVSAVRFSTIVRLPL
jgi:hypothetical protein